MNSASKSLAAAGVSAPLTIRAVAIALLLCIEKAALNFFVDFGVAQQAMGAAGIARALQHFGLRFLLTAALAIGLFCYVRGNPALREINAEGRSSPIRLRWLGLHLLLMALLAPLLASAYSNGTASPYFAELATAALVLATGGLIAALAAAAPLALWVRAARALGIVWLYALLAGLAATLTIQWSQGLWQPTSRITFQMVRWLLAWTTPVLEADPNTLILSTPRFAVQISELCSGLEGVGLILAFSSAWLLFFRDEYRFPRALVLVPVGAALIFLLNAVRIAALVVLGDVGFADIAAAGFHSQAGWIAFNVVACALVIVSRRIRWFAQPSNAAARGARTKTENPTAAYLMPFLGILVGGMLAHLLSSGFEMFYSLRLFIALGCLAVYAPALRQLRWSFSWRGPLVGIAVFGLWMAGAYFQLPTEPVPETLGAAPDGLRYVWIAGRFLTGVLLVPIAEELAFRGYLLRRLVRPEFETVRFQDIRWWPLLASSLLFGVGHGSMYLPAALAGLAYGAVVMRTGRIGEAISAHAVTNLLVALTVLVYDQWQLW